MLVQAQQGCHKPVTKPAHAAEWVVQDSVQHNPRRAELCSTSGVYGL